MTDRERAARLALLEADLAHLRGRLVGEPADSDDDDADDAAWTATIDYPTKRAPAVENRAIVAVPTYRGAA